MPKYESFAHANLNEIDPNWTPVPDDRYKLQIQSMTLHTFEYKNGPSAGTTGERIAVRLAIVEHPEFSGRVLWDNFWLKESDFKSMRKIMDATGIPQDGDIQGWLEAITQEQPVVDVFVSVVEETNRQTGNTEPTNKVVWREVQPA